MIVLYFENYRLVFLGYFVFYISLLFGPLIYYYIKKLLGSNVTKGIFISQIPGILSVIYGCYLISVENTEKQRIFQQMLEGNHLFYEIINLLTLILTLIYCVKAWLFINEIKSNQSKNTSFNLKVSWAKEFVMYMFANVFVFLILVLVLTKGFKVTSIDMDLIGMPVFMLFVYLLVAVRSMMMYKEFEHQLVLAKIQSDKDIQGQRIEIARNLHDSLGAQLTFIASVTDGLKKHTEHLDDNLKSKTETLAVITENAISELKNALWVLNTNEVRLEDIKFKLLNFVNTAGEVKEDLLFHSDFNIKENLLINSKIAVELYRIVQEIINNTIKYAQAKDVWIKLVQTGNKISLVIKDNGIGFDVDKVKLKSFGLSNLHYRVQTLNGKLKIESEKDKGTTFFIEIILE